MEVEAFPFLTTISAKQSAVQVQKHMLRTLDRIDDVPESFVNVIKLQEGILIHTVKNLDNVGCEARRSFSRIALKTGSKVNSSEQSSSK